MLAPVYRHLDTKATFAGLSFPVEWLPVIGVVYVGAATDNTGVGLFAAAGLYAFLRIVGYNRPENFLQHWILFRIRAAYSSGRFSSAARAPAPHFPFGSYLTRDVPSRRAS